MYVFIHKEGEKNVSMFNKCIRIKICLSLIILKQEDICKVKEQRMCCISYELKKYIAKNIKTLLQCTLTNLILCQKLNPINMDFHFHFQQTS